MSRRPSPAVRPDRIQSADFERRAGTLPAAEEGPALVPGRLLAAGRGRRGRRLSPSTSSQPVKSVSEVAREWFEATSTRTTCSCTGSASRRPRPWPSTSTSRSAWSRRIADQDPRNPQALPAGLPGQPLQLRLPGLPEPRGPGPADEAVAAGKNRHRRSATSISSILSKAPARSSPITRKRGISMCGDGSTIDMSDHKSIAPITFYLENICTTLAPDPIRYNPLRQSGSGGRWRRLRAASEESPNWSGYGGG
jgi:hypothetical protein